MKEQKCLDFSVVDFKIKNTKKIAQDYLFGETSILRTASRLKTHSLDF